MYRKLMFLISLVALLGLVNAAVADIEWDGGGVDNSFCTPENWDPDVVPGPGDTALSECGKDIVIDCDVTVDELLAPTYESDCNQAMDIVSGTIVCGSWEAIKEGDKTGWINATGGSMTVNGTVRWNDDGAEAAYVTLGGDFMLTVADRIRSGDSGTEHVHITITDDAVVTVLADGDGYLRIGDDGGGSFTVSGNASVTLLHDGDDTDEGLHFGGRENSVTVDISGNCEIYCAGNFGLGKGDDLRESVDMTMSGGTVNCKVMHVGWEADSDGSASLTMTGGLLIVREELKIGSDDGSGEVHLDGGVLRIDSADSLEMKDNASIDITGGALVLAGNQLAMIGQLVCEEGKLTGYGTPAAVVADYDVTNPGKTTVTAVAGVDPKKAYCPEPANGADRVRSDVTEVVFSWTRGSGVQRAGGDRVFFGDDPVAVENATTSDPEFKGQVRYSDPPEWNIGNLPLWQTFYWRIDEVNDDRTTTKGDVWSFTTGCEDIAGDTNKDCLLNFLDYADVASTWMQQQLWP